MVSALIITPIENLQDEINKVVGSFKEGVGIYVSLNKTQKSVEEILKKKKINTEKLFFIDCTSSEKIREDVLYIHPSELDKLSKSIKKFMEDIKEKKFLLIDSLATFLIYNHEREVEEFVKEIVEYSSKNNTEMIALSPKTKGEEMLNKIEILFDKVKKIN